MTRAIEPVVTKLKSVECTPCQVKNGVAFFGPEPRLPFGTMLLLEDFSEADRPLVKVGTVCTYETYYEDTTEGERLRVSKTTVKR